MKSFLRASAAAGLAAATVVSGLSLSASPADASASAPTAVEDVQLGPLVTASTLKDYAAPYSTGAQGVVPFRGGTTPATVKAKAVNWYIPVEGSNSRVRPASHPNLCLTFISSNVTDPQLQTCRANDSAQLWRLSSTTSDFNVSGTGIESVAHPGRYFGISYVGSSGSMYTQPAPAADRIETLADFEPLFATDIIDALGSEKVSVRRGGSGKVYSTFQAKKAFTNPTEGTITFIAPEGTRFKSGQDHQAGQYKTSSGSWTNFGGDSIKDGQLSSDGRTYTFQLNDRSWSVAKDQQFRFALDITADNTAALGSRNVSAKLTGKMDTGSFDTTATTTVEVTAADVVTGAITVPPMKQGETSSVTEFTFDDNPFGTGYFTAPTGTTIASIENVNGAGTTTPGSIAADAKTATIGSDGWAWGQPVKLRVTLKANSDAALGAVSDGSFETRIASDVTAKATVSTTIETSVENGGVAAADSPSTSLQQGETARVPFAVKATEQYTQYAADITLTAPEGTTFARSQTVAGQWRKNGTEAWRAGSPQLDLTDVTVSADGKTLTGKFDSSRTNGFDQDAGYQQRWLPTVIADADAPLGNTTLGYSIEGTTEHGATKVESSSPVTITAAASTVTPVAIHAGFDSADEFAPAKLEVTGEPGAQVSVVNTATNEQLGTVTLNDSGKATVSVDPSKAQAGVNSFTATQTVDGDTTTASDTLDYGQNTGLEVTAPVNGSTVQGPRPTFTGTGKTGAKITVRGTTRTVGSGTVIDGQWSFPASMDLNPNFYALTATQTTKGGLTTTRDVSFTITASKPVTDLTATASFDPDDANNPAIVSGSATAGATVVLKDALGNVIATTTAKSGNEYSMTIPPASAKVGVNDFTVTQRIDGKDIDSKSVSLDYGQPAPITITSPANGATVAKDGLTFTGTGQDGAKIAVKGMVNTIATGTVSGSTWSAPVAFPLTSNVYQLWAVQTTKGGLRTQQAITITVADTVTTPLTATAQFDPTDVNLPAQIVGSAQLDATVIVRDSNGVEVGRKQATGGNYTITIPAAKAHFGVNAFTVTQVVSGIESAPVTRTLDYGTPAAPTISSPVQNAMIENGSLHFTGTGATGAKLTLRGMVNPLGDTTIDNGTWTVDIARNLTPNVYRLFAVQTSKGGLTKQAEVTVTIKDKTVTALTATGAFDPDVTRLATISGAAQTGGTVVITEGATTIATIPVTGSTYTAEIPATVAGVRTFTVTQTVDGVTSAPKTVTLDYGTVTPLEVLTPTEGQYVPSGQLTFTGTATNGAHVKVGGTTSTLGTATADATTGAFTIPVTRTLTPQVYVLYVKQTTKGGLISDATVRTITITQ